MADIASRLGVSKCTVSLALKDSPKISDKTTARVRKLAEKLDYTPNHQARSLRTQTTRHIGVVLPELANPVYAEKLQAVHAVADENGYALDFYCTQWDDQKEARIIQQLIAGQADGLILLTPSCVDSLDAIRRFAGLGKPVCVLNNLQENIPGVSTIFTDYGKASAHAMEYLLSLGHRSFGLLGIRTGQGSPPNHVRRMNGIHKALKNKGLGPESIESMPTNGASIDHGEEAILLYHQSHGTVPSALICLNDSIAMGALSGLYQLGLRVPQDVSVIGYDNIQAAAHTIPPLTTVNINTTQLGKQAIEMILEQIRQKHPDPRHILQVPELLVRQSTGIAREQ